MPIHEDIIEAGERLAYLNKAQNNLNSYHNKELGPYQEMLASIQAVFGSQKTLRSLTDDEVNQFYYKGLADAPGIAYAKAILDSWEDAFLRLDEKVKTLPGNLV